jgi:xylulokinase
VSLLGIDVGTTGCKAAAYTPEGELLAETYREYDVQRPQPGWAELDAHDVWNKVCACIRSVAAQTTADPVSALAVSSLGEAVVPADADRSILGPSLLNFDARGEGYVSRIADALRDDELYRITGNALGNHFSLTKLMWLQEHQPELWSRARYLLPWESLVAYLLGAEAVVDFSLANRTLLFDLDSRDWSQRILSVSQIDEAMLPRTAPAGTRVGTVSPQMADQLGLEPNVAIVTGAHDQCANAIGAGVLDEGHAMYGMGTYICIVPPFRQRQDPSVMLPRGLNTEHHAAPGLYVSFIYNHGGSLFKWYRDTFAAAERDRAKAEGRDIYAELIAEMPGSASTVVALPHFAPTGPPDFITDATGAIAGLRLETVRGDILKGILEGATYYLRQCIDELPAAGMKIERYRAVGGGSRSDAWIQMSADIMGTPFERTRITEAGTLGAAILAGVGSGAYASVRQGVAAMVAVDRIYEPNSKAHAVYGERYALYGELWPLLGSYLRRLHKAAL